MRGASDLTRATAWKGRLTDCAWASGYRSGTLTKPVLGCTTEIATSRRELWMGIDREKNEANTAWKVADIKGLTLQGQHIDGH